jgi:argonaute-like protein implicated in RNA metabolism and viral defense
MVIFLTGNKIENEPNLLFDKADSSAVHHQVYWGLRRFGPYDKSISKIRLVIISPETKIAQVRNLIEELNNGTPILPGGLPQFFRCSIDIVDEIAVKSIDTSDYEKAGISFVKKNDPKNLDVVLAYVPKTSRYFSNTPYYRLKAILASQGFSSQMITEWTFENLKWSYLNLASAIFSKAGGIPWVLESEMKNIDMILGISISNFVSYRNRAGLRPRYVGYVNVFDNHGGWMFIEGTATLYEKGQSADQLKELLTKAIERFKARKNFLPKNIALHYYKKFGKPEIEVTCRILDELIGEYSIAFISIDDTHPIRLYDLKVDDGSFPRGYYAYLNQNEILLSTTGFTTLAARRMGTPKLLHVRVKQYPEDFINIDEIVMQVFSLTKIDWATVTPLVREPVTLQFSREVSYLTAAISEQEWQSIVRPEVNVILNTKPWFI